MDTDDTNSDVNDKPLISFDSPFSDPVRRTLFNLAGDAAGRVLGADKVNDIYREIRKQGGDGAFMSKCLDVMRVKLDIPPADLSRIPKTGPVVVVANHPFGGIEGIVLAHVLSGARPDFKLMANYLLGRIAEFRPWLILVDPFDRKDSRRVNTRPLKDSLQWLKGGHMLATFPSGEVSHLNLKRGGIVDPTWSPMIARLIRSTEATVLPVYFRGANGPLFQMSGMLHPRLRTALLAQEFANKAGATISVRIGNPVAFNRLSHFTNDEELTDYLRLLTYNLKRRKNDRRGGTPRDAGVVADAGAIIEPARSSTLHTAELAALPPEQKLLTSGTMSVWYARTPQIPHILHELGRLREQSFRLVGEGTGTALDLDEFDDHYIHLFIWNEEKHEIVGAYRLGATDEILPRFGRKGLYTSTLFRCSRRLLTSINPALEMGRSFIRPEYQRSYAPLLMLWKGIGHFVAAHPRYKYLFGPVSLSAEYTTMSRNLLVRFLRRNNMLPDLARLVRPRHPLLINPIARMKDHRLQRVVKSMDDVETFIADIESGFGGAPVLLRQYLKLGGKLLGFNIDPDFSGVLDGLILVDLTETDPVILGRYFPKGGVPAYRAHHGIAMPEPKTKT